jgi:hypothetical protein
MYCTNTDVTNTYDTEDSNRISFKLSYIHTFLSPLTKMLSLCTITNQGISVRRTWCPIEPSFEMCGLL